MEPEDEAFQELDKKLNIEKQKKVATGVSDSLWRKWQIENIKCPHCGAPLEDRNDKRIP
jgi:hypothetical protein